MPNAFNPTKEILRVQTDYQRVPAQFLQNRFLNGKYNSDLTPTELPVRPEQDPRLAVEMEAEDQEIEDAFWLP